MPTTQQREEYTNTLLKFLGKVNEWNLPYTQSKVAEDLNWLHRQEATLHRLAEKQCNEGLTESDERRVDNIEKFVTDALALYHIPVRFNHDPRGGSIRMIMGERISNNWDGETWGIYW
jgi:hypothetical protein